MLVEWGILELQNDTYFPTYSTVTLVAEAVTQASLAADLKRVCYKKEGCRTFMFMKSKALGAIRWRVSEARLALENKVIFNKYRKFDALVDQLINVGATSHDDLLDAYTWLMTFLQRRGNFSIEY